MQAVEDLHYIRCATKQFPMCRREIPGIVSPDPYPPDPYPPGPEELPFAAVI